MALSRLAFAGFFTFSFVLTSCITKDDTFGQGFIPHEGDMKMKVDSSFVIKTYNIETDSIESSGFYTVYLGHKSDPLAGDMHGEIIFQMSAPYFSDEDEKFGYSPTIDSIRMVLYIADSLGAAGIEQIFEVYEMNYAVHRDSIYYADFDPTPFIGSTPLFEFLNSINAEGYIFHKIEDETLKAELLDTTDYSIDTLFRDRFKGWYVKPKNNTAGNIYGINLANSYLAVDYHNKNEDPDTLTVLYRFVPTNSSNYETIPFSQSVNMVSYDYSTADPSLRINDTINPVPKTFVQSYGGLATILEFTNESVNKIKSDVKAAGFSEIVLNKAKLEISFPNTDYVSLEHSFDRLGLYTDIIHYVNIPDYDYYTESVYGYSLIYGGYINRSRDFYQMDITMYVQRLFREEYQQTKIYLGPSVDEFNTLKQIELDGYESDNPVRLILTYTMLR